MRIAIVHDDLTQRGGAERVVETMYQIWPDAIIYTSVYDPDGTFESFRTTKIVTSFMQKIPFASRQKYSKLFLSLFPIAFETLDLRGFDLVISHGTRFAHGVITSTDTCHIHYCHTPARFAWRYHEYVEEGNFNYFALALLPLLIHKLRQWDQLAIFRVDYIFSNSFNIYKRVSKYYNRSSDILYPPVDVNRFYISTEGVSNYLLVVSRLLPYKKIDIVIEACNKLKIPLKIVGTGPDSKRLKRLAGRTIEFLGRVPDGEVEHLFAKCKAFVFPGEEDFGIAPLEAMAAGRPVIAFRAGGAVETVVENVTGVFFERQDSESILLALEKFDKIEFDSEVLRQHAQKFSVEAFNKRICFLVEKCMKLHKEKNKIPETDYINHE